MSVEHRIIFLSLYAACVAALGLIEQASPLYRALCQVRAEIERQLDLPRTPTRRAH